MGQHGADGAAGADSAAGGRTVEVVRPGALTTVQDLGRRGFAHLGVPASGALDPAAYARANRLVGNSEGAPVLETTVDGVALRFPEPAVIAVTGAYAPVLVEGRRAGWSLPVHVGAEDLVDVGPARVGVRCYLAVAGGFDVAATLGSCATDLLSGLGPPPLAAGERLAIGAPQGPVPAVDLAPYRLPKSEIDLPVHPGPRRSWLSEQGERDLFDKRYTVSPESNRIALRLSGVRLGRRPGRELPSEGMVWGSVELLHSGEILVFLADHPTTGGYPVIAVVDASAASDCAQARPGDTVAFRRAGGGPGAFGGW